MFNVLGTVPQDQANVMKNFHKPFKKLSDFSFRLQNYIWIVPKCGPSRKISRSVFKKILRMK